jgi:ABC-type dipeptide/oligopeptide/nickel transport system permease component
MWIGRIAQHLAVFVITTVIAGLLGAMLVRFGPGFEADEQQFDPRLDAQSIQALRESHSRERSLLKFYDHFLVGMASGDLGFSLSLARPVRELLSEWAKVTLQFMGAGLAGGWILGLALAVPVHHCPAIIASGQRTTWMF